ncbi:MAG: carboxypeptidase-like regulatory domain-containing protein [bacterium]
MIKKVYISFLIIFVFLIGTPTGPLFTFASSSIGTIDNVYKYAKGVDTSNLKINMGLFKGSVNVVVTDTEITGFGWGENIGWINFAPKNGGVMNNGEGILSGTATSELGGIIDFKPTGSGVTISSSGDFLGYALSEKLGRISFNCSNDDSCAIDDYKVKTDWRPISVRGMPEVPPEILPVVPPDDVVPPVEDTLVVTPPNGTGIVTPVPQPILDYGQYQGGDKINYSKNSSTFTQNNNNVGYQDGLLNSAVVSNIAEATKEASSFVQKKTIEIKKEAVILVSTPAVDISTKTLTTVGVAGGSTAIVSSFAGSAFAFSEILLNFLRIWSLFLSAIGLRKKTKPWGTVYDSVTKQPIDPAYVVLQDKNNKEIATSITDFDGRYGFLVTKDAYKIYVRKNNYSFPSRKLFGKKEDELYQNLYFGDFLDLKEDELIIKNIPMDPEKFDWNEFAKKDKKLFKFNSPYARFFARISNILFYFGFVLALFLLIINTFNYYNLAIILIYLVLLLMRIVGVKVKSYGKISEKESGAPLSFAVIRIFNKGHEKESIHRVADKYGRYYCLLPKGEYYITIEKKNNDESYTKIYTSENFILNKGILNKDFRL